jgi:hypothetical protein
MPDISNRLSRRPYSVVFPHRPWRPFLILFVGRDAEAAAADAEQAPDGSVVHASLSPNGNAAISSTSSCAHRWDKGAQTEPLENMSLAALVRVIL